ncbi:MAG TPA: hypothetical protein VFT39_12990 [Vicinamibacterales bacterium]|nr:hypothetical protein [Vicinamibacterales bacterium]
MPGVPAGAGRARALRASVVLALSLAYLFYVFDISHETFWTAGLGDWLDPYFINYLLEHWYHALWTFSDPFSPPMFYPAEKAIGYSHSLILYAPFYVPLRLFVHPFQAYSLTLLVVIETGILCLYVIFRRFLQLTFVESLLLTAFFLSSPNVINETVGVWSQRASVFLVPPILLLALVSWRDRPGRRRFALAGLSGFLATLLFAHDFYSGYFAFFFATIFVAAWAVVERRLSSATPVLRWSTWPLTEKVALASVAMSAAWTVYLWETGGIRTRILGIRIASQDWRRPALLCMLCVAVFVWLRGVSRIRADLKTGWMTSRLASSPWIGALALGATAGAAVFLWGYLPAYREHPRFPEQDLLDQIRVRTWHGWTGVFHDLNAYDTSGSFKLVALAGIFACVPGVRILRKTRWYVLWAVVVSALVFVMPLRIDDFSIWLSFLRYIPGFSVIRDPTRVIFLYELAFILAVALLLTAVRQRPAYRAGICLLCAYFLVVDYRVVTLGYARPVRFFHQWVEAPIQIDPACRSFYIKGASPDYMSRSPNRWGLYSGDAMFIALKHGLPTLNGYSAWFPPGWELTNPQQPTYPERVREWIGKNNLKAVCELDIEARTMRAAPMN